MKYNENCFYMYLQISKLLAICNKCNLFIRNSKEMFEITTKYKASPDIFSSVHIIYMYLTKCIYFMIKLDKL